MASLRLGARRTAKGRMPRNVAPCRRLVKCLYSRRPGTRPVPWSPRPAARAPAWLAAARRASVRHRQRRRRQPALRLLARSASSNASRCSSQRPLSCFGSRSRLLNRRLHGAQLVQHRSTLPRRQMRHQNARLARRHRRPGAADDAGPQLQRHHGPRAPGAMARPVPQSSPCSTEGIAQPPEYDRTLGRPLQNGSLDLHPLGDVRSPFNLARSSSRPSLLSPTFLVANERSSRRTGAGAVPGAFTVAGADRLSELPAGSGVKMRASRFSEDRSGSGLSGCSATIKYGEIGVATAGRATSGRGGHEKRGGRRRRRGRDRTVRSAPVGRA